MPKVTDLEARIAELEAENAELRAVSVEDPTVVPKRRRSRGRTAAAIALVLIGCLLAPVALISGWARLELVDTDRFVDTFAPIAADPEVQTYLSDEISTAINAQLDIEGLTSDLFAGIEQLELPPKATAALSLLEGPAVSGIESLIGQTVTRFVESDAFAETWETALRFTHTNLIASMQGDPEAAIEIGGDGTLSLQLGPVIDVVKQKLVDRGLTFVESIPSINLSVALAQNDAFVLVQTLYALSVAAGTWLPWVMLVFLIAGVFVANRRMNALAWTAGGFAFSLLLLASGVGVGRMFFLQTVSPSVMPLGAAEAVFDGLLRFMMSALTAFIVLGLFIMIIAWFMGSSKPAIRVRAASDSGLRHLRESADDKGVTTGAFGRGLDRWAGLVFLAIALFAAAVILFARPLSASLVVWTVVVALLVALLVQLLRRPAFIDATIDDLDVDLGSTENADADELAPDAGTSQR